MHLPTGRQKNDRQRTKYKIVKQSQSRNINKNRKTYSYNKYERKALENGWNSIFAQNQTENKLILEKELKAGTTNVNCVNSNFNRLDGQKRKRPKSAFLLFRWHFF